MRLTRAATLAVLFASAHAGASAAALGPSSGRLTVSGMLAGGGRFEIDADLKGGNFTGTGKVTVGGQSFEGPLLPRRSYLENGKCYFRFEQGRARGDISGKCDSSGMEGRFETFVAGDLRNGASSGRVTVAGGGMATAAAGQLPTAKLTCAYQDRRIGVRPGETTQFSLQSSNLATLTLAAGRYSAGRSAGGSFERVGADKIRLTSGPWSGALGTLEPDRSGRPAVVFHIEENRRPDGVHLVDPSTTRCTESRS
ncbi:hypothetical protein LZ009_19885 [Ramlibacter sp. XY19]|uniref:hypothetical protein n=1 Tax=Ramlibacter paludis TaxID=2908000 RepID=UPI0023DAD60B|nr:hypothetical protein [Ramlibacter paludis]MCG2595046.1 hypothetical protein [Ramlibacter paludis]